MVLAEFSMYPTDKGESVSEYVAQLIDHIDRTGITYQLTPMGTILEGSWDQVFGVIGDCFKILEPQSNRITTIIKVDYRKGTESRMKSKVEKVKSILKREIRHS
ncbi:MAG: MTH1187 family thiamine-binding protein [candidate division KSB1 bacterium]|nr:MTH1187 family thiamine-binding protein [candidate division KSB1 bacterium]MDZ7336659.1 MTH1187 family thiamine-binding protein [candidate division KSB1 bacterium]MDZ7359008.1 MTH1187 family thiamine-binding protein [candidate division KSB1 bacterium]MDZ7402310.1 MTH1187 family thiamine-binding protein [candidate division KSB1 bacterium]